jgi:hypothetical protein
LLGVIEFVAGIVAIVDCGGKGSGGVCAAGAAVSGGVLRLLMDDVRERGVPLLLYAGGFKIPFEIASIMYFCSGWLCSLIIGKGILASFNVSSYFFRG